MEDQQSEERISNKQKIEIYLTEYESLRRDMECRMNNRFNLLGVGIGLISFIAATQQVRVSAWVITGLLLFIVLVWWWLGWLIMGCSQRVSQIEQNVNKLAGEELLVWESSFINKPRRLLRMLYR